MLTRREVLSIPIAAALAASCRRQPPPFDEAAFVLPRRSAVGLFPAANYDVNLDDVIFRGLADLGIDVRGKSVLLKPNMVEYEANTAINTDPRVVAGAAIALRRAGAREVVVGEGPGHRRDIEYLLTATGMFDRLRDASVRFVDLNHDAVRDVPLKSWFTGMRSLNLPVSLLAADLVVSMPKLKTHHWAGMTCGMKNLFGCVPGAVYGWPKNILHMHGIDASILDLVATIRPGLTIVDAVVGMEGDGPIMGKARTVGFIGISADVVAMDATCARIIGLNPDKLPYLSAGGSYLGLAAERQIEMRGEDASRYRGQFDVVDMMKSRRLAG